MKIKRFFAKDMRTALKEVKEELGVDAVIMSNKKLANGVEIVAAVDYDKAATKPPEQPQSQPAARASFAHTEQSSHNFVKPEPQRAQPKPQAKVADSLQALLERQSPRPRSAELASMFSHSGIDTSGHYQEQEPVQSRPKNMFEREQSAPVRPRTQADSLGFDDLDSGFDDLDSPSAPRQQTMHKESSDISTMREEMNAIRQLLEHQVSGLMQQDMARRDPTRACMIDRLVGMGIEKNVAEQMACFVPDDVSRQQGWKALLNMVEDQMQTTNNEILRQGGVFALVGPTGVGKTTTVAKLAALGAQKYGADKVALITTDTYRIGAYEQLATYGRIIGCGVKQVKDANELAEVLYHLRNKRLVLIDTAGMSQRDLRLTEQLNTLMRNQRVDIRSYLVLSATAQINVLQETVRHFKKVQLSGCIFTKLDESLSLGEIISIAIQNRLPIGYLTNGQRVPEDIRVANAEKLVKKAEQLYLKRIKAQQSRHQSVASSTVEMYD
ncbi:Flagellar biosynthesis regulator FlhF [Pseudoalteromonas issachenkonii]|jgi:flagellar biosynthesis protein FlhF|uniref:Flagellar biosynthesis protein FlhF n=2 Tax=Pseudoalteromonas TaxID=53246 RepID=A0AB39AN15_9GAMM|nr:MULTISPECIES: flagellar biosynthesis protein FlhF [Pseudoalteromonas]PHQ94684.1 MAG: flagellar biosynthesis protein FlhF [Pseudoalteromonas sp.]ADT69156.1 flagellar biosynthesis regulator FlhF [Pseudoalteromonas sp. SM9913]ALQ55461.1 Flagellar biosynthesis regulator FlhF [Pseudoalteromonas issachenkonii]ATC91314.1 flagellar biosynthesis protein FlhF [Pseudoalteromonas issachenkonii]MDN3395816.1 flagellar biosynthesis protein FlhF [Pseudoalteromonas sp. APC 3215]|tara:strand:- start:948 stop:2438 length:1491 start_codon:yes stop_codon:yes gene_type:complete